MKITKRQLRRIIKEERAKLNEGTTNFDVDILSSDDLYDLLVDKVEEHLARNDRVTLERKEIEMMRNALQRAVNYLENDYS